MFRNLGSENRRVRLLWIISEIIAILFFPLSFARAETPQDNGGWSKPAVLFDQPGVIDAPLIVADRVGRLHVFWHLAHEFSRNEAIYYLRSDPILNEGSPADPLPGGVGAGPRWSEPVLLQLRNQLGPPSAVVDDAGTIHLVFQSSDHILWYTRAAADQATDQGNWSTPVQVGRSQVSPQIALGPGSELYLVYGGVNVQGVLLRTSSDGGSSWSRSRMISPPYDTQDRVDDVRIAIESSRVLHVAWSEFTRSANRPAGVYYTRSLDGGNEWSPAFQLAGGGFTQVNLVYSTSTGELHAAWNGVGSAKGRYYRRSADAGYLWQDVEDISPVGTGGSEGLPQMVVDANGTLSLLTGEAGCAWYLQRQTAWQTPFCFSHAERIAQPGMALLNGRQLAAVFQERNQSNYRLDFSLRRIDAPEIVPQPFDRLNAASAPSETPPLVPSNTVAPLPSATPVFTPTAVLTQTPSPPPTQVSPTMTPSRTTRSNPATPLPSATSRPPEATPAGTAVSQVGPAQPTPTAQSEDSSAALPEQTLTIPDTGSADPQPMDTSQIILISLAPTLVGLLILIGSRILRRNRPDY